MLDLREVTLCAVDTLHALLAARALTRSMAGCRFGDAVLFSDVECAGPFRCERIAPISGHSSYSTFLLKGLAERIRTPFALIIQYDGWVLDPAAWVPEFLDYDYIGARWPWVEGDRSVGNGGFSLRSKKLLKALAAPRFTVHEKSNEDTVICQVYRDVLEGEYGIRFAPASIADLFSYELVPPKGSTFGFHGFSNLWKHMDEREICALTDQLKLGGRLDSSLTSLMLQFHALGKLEPMRAMYFRLRSLYSAEELFRLMDDSSPNKAAIPGCFRDGEALLGRAGRPGAFPRQVEQMLGHTRAIAKQPGWAGAVVEAARSKRLAGDYDASRLILEKGLRETSPESRERQLIEHKLGWHELRDGHFKRGLKMDRIGRKLHAWGALAQQRAKPPLSPADGLAGKTVLICGEGGVGDELTHARFARTIAERGGKSIWLTPRPLAGLLARTSGIERVIGPADEAATAYDFWVPCSELPIALDLDAPELPDAPYVSANPRFLDKWAARVPQGQGLKVGLRWGGDPGLDAELGRGVPLKALESWFGIPGIQWFSLVTDQRQELALSCLPIADWGGGFESWEDTAAAIAQLDLVISTCTSVAHLAGAMGKPVWVLCSADPYYIWAARDQHTPWYRSARIFKQDRSESWREPIERIGQGLRFRGLDAGALMNRSIALFNEGRFTESQAIQEKLHRDLPPAHPAHEAVYYNLHWHWMREGRFKEGMKAFLSLGKKRDVSPRSFPGGQRPALLSASESECRGKRILVMHDNGGAGDEIINVRFVKLLHSRGARVIWKTNHALQSLFSRVEGMDQVVDDNALPELDFDCWAPEGSLVDLLEVDVHELSREPYLSVQPDRLKKWSDIIPNRGRLRVGLRWQGMAGAESDPRSVPYDVMRRLLEFPDADFFSLQRDTGMEKIRPGDPIVDLSSALGSWEDTAAAISRLDLVITNCTSIVHLAGALGKRTWLYTPAACFYIWALPGDRSAWYRDVRLFRQSRTGDWSEVTRRISEALREELASGGNGVTRAPQREASLDPPPP